MAMLLVISNATAKNVSPGVARKVATNFMKQKTSETLVFEDVTKQIGYTNFYIFNATNTKSFVIVAADDIVQPILAYSTNSPFKTENMPQNIRLWLTGYEKEIQWAIDNYEEATEETADEWRILLSGGVLENRSDKAVNALISTTWNQSPLYNNLCPSNSYTGQHAVTGCVATAMAQIMRYWSFPENGRSFHSYNCNFGTLSANFANTTYDWNNMPNQLDAMSTNAQINAVATLMYHCGVSVDMDYGLSASAAYSTNVANALRTYFKYDSTIRIASNPSASTLKNELDAGRPIFYSGNDGANPGHAFVCDGYDNSNNFHFNWGWGGMCDGFFSLNNLRPSTGGTGAGSRNYTSNQLAIIGIQPTTASTHSLKMNASLTLNSSQYQFGSNITSYFQVLNNGHAPFSGYLAVAIFHGQNILVKINPVSISGLLYNNYTTQTIRINGGVPLVPGPYIAYVMSSTDGNYWDIVQSSSNATYLTSFSVYHYADIETNSTFSTINFVYGEPATVNVDILNSSADTFYGYVYLCLSEPTNDSIVQVIDTLDLTNGLQAGGHFRNGINFTTNAITANPGTYLLKLVYQQANSTSLNYVGSRLYTNPLFATVVGPPVMSVSPDSMSFQGAGGTKSIEITSNVNWNVSSNAYWLTVTPYAGAESGYVDATAAANTSISPRSATITIRGNNGLLSHTIVVNQGGSNSIDEVEADNLSIQALHNRIIVSGLSGEQVFVSDVLGRVVYNATSDQRTEIMVNKRGIYFVRVGDRPARKVAVVW